MPPHPECSVGRVGICVTSFSLQATACWGLRAPRPPSLAEATEGLVSWEAAAPEEFSSLLAALLSGCQTPDVTFGSTTVRTRLGALGMKAINQS